jgi:hypothetical protein
MNIADKKAVVVDFLGKCNEYANGKLAEYAAELPTATGWESLAIQDRISHWTAYRTFNDHTLEELAGAELDDWFR